MDRFTVLFIKLRQVYHFQWKLFGAKTMAIDEKRSSDDRRSSKDRRSGVDTRSEEEKRLVGERRSTTDRRSGRDRRSSTPSSFIREAGKRDV
jgi:hypothetical protein